MTAMKILEKHQTHVNGRQAGNETINQETTY
jgi:hypothetical protein